MVILLLVATSCSSIRVATDYDKNANFDNFKTFAFFKTGIDKAEINDLDKRRILRAIESELLAKGFTKSETPDLLISLFTKSNQRVDVYNNSGFGWGLGWGGPFWGMNYSRVTTTPEGTLFIDLIDAKTKELVWQGEGTGYLTKDSNKKDERTKVFVNKILEQYPPKLK